MLLRKVVLGVASSWVCLAAVSVASASFVVGDLVVFRADSSSSSNTTFHIDELKKTTANQPSTVSSTLINGTTGPNALRTSGSATSTGYLARSSDRQLLTFTGHNTTTTSGNINTILPRGVGSLTNGQVFSLQTTYTGASGNQTRAATTLNNTDWFIGDQNGFYSNGSTSRIINANLRSVKSFGGVVYTLQQSSTSSDRVVSSISSTAPGATLTGLAGLSNDNNAQDFYMVSSANNSVFDILYITRNTGAIAKFSLVGGTWTANGTYTSPFSSVFGLAAEFAASGSANLYITTGTGATDSNSVVKLTDTAGLNATISVTTANNANLYTAGSGTTLKGIEFAPIPEPSAAVFGGIVSISAGLIFVSRRYSQRSPAPS